MTRPKPKVSMNTSSFAFSEDTNFLIMGLVEAGIYPSRSEVIRQAIKRQIDIEIKMENKLEKIKKLIRNFINGRNLLQILTVYIPKLYIDIIDKYVGNRYASKSEFIRAALYNFLDSEADSNIRMLGGITNELKSEDNVEPYDIVSKIKQRIDKGVINQYVRK